MRFPMITPLRLLRVMEQRAAVVPAQEQKSQGAQQCHRADGEKGLVEMIQNAARRERAEQPQHGAAARHAETDRELRLTASRLLPAPASFCREISPG